MFASFSFIVDYLGKEQQRQHQDDQPKQPEPHVQEQEQQQPQQQAQLEQRVGAQDAAIAADDSADVKFDDVVHEKERTSSAFTSSESGQ
jgi:hypothetical protein